MILGNDEFWKKKRKSESNKIYFYFADQKIEWFDLTTLFCPVDEIEFRSLWWIDKRTKSFE